MANNFKLTGTVYVSIDGSDSNSGLTKDLPKRTVQAGFTAINGSVGGTLVIGAGVYNETIAMTTVSGTNITIIGDGQVVLDGANKTWIFGGANNLVTLNFNNLLFKNFRTFEMYSLNFNRHEVSFTNCTLINLSFNAASTLALANWYFASCIFINVTDAFVTTLVRTVSFCVFINSTILSTASFINSYVNSASVILVVVGTVNFNNIQGSIRVSAASIITSGVYQDMFGRYYDLSQAGTNPSGNGSLAQPYYRAETASKGFSFATHRILYPLVNANSISTDPLFNNILTQDFTLQATSPMIGTASDGINNIGGTKYAGRHTAKGTTFNAGAISVTNLAFLGNDYVVSGAASGEVISAPLFHSSTTKIIQKISYNGLYEFNKALGAGPVAGNRNVPDELVYTTGTQGANPDRLVYYLRYSTQTAQPASDPEWDNGSNWTAGNYEVFEWNTKPSIDSLTKGNGQPDFNAADTPVYLNATWVQLKVKLRNDYV